MTYKHIYLIKILTLRQNVPPSKNRSNIVHVNEPLSSEESYTSKESAQMKVLDINVFQEF